MKTAVMDWDQSLPSPSQLLLFWCLLIEDRELALADRSAHMLFFSYNSNI